PDEPQAMEATALRKSGVLAPATGAATPAPPTPTPTTTLERVQVYLGEARRCFERGDLVAAAIAASQAFACDVAGECADAREGGRQLLLRIFETQLGSLKKVPRAQMMAEQISKLGLAPRFGFVLDRIDGSTSFDDLLDIAGMPRLDALRILEALLRASVI